LVDAEICSSGFKHAADQSGNRPFMAKHRRQQPDYGGLFCYQLDEQFIGTVFLVSIKRECNSHSGRAKLSI
jgi:hypothetical protein